MTGGWEGEHVECNAGRDRKSIATPVHTEPLNDCRLPDVKMAAAAAPLNKY